MTDTKLGFAIVMILFSDVVATLSKRFETIFLFV